MDNDTHGPMSDTLPLSLTSALVTLGPNLVDQCEAVSDVGRSASCLAPVKHAASIKDSSFFSNLPPMLLHDDYHVSASKLYGGTEASKIADAAYRQGPFNEVKRCERHVHGALLFDCGGVAYPVLVYTVDAFRGERAVVAHIYSAPLAELEADLFDDRKPVSSLEDKWLGGSAQGAHNMRMHMGAHLRAGGLATMPGFLLTDNYHLVRGALPWLHFRCAANTAEIAKLKEALLAALAFCDHVDGEGQEWSALGTVDNAMGIMANRKIVTVFDRCPDPYLWVPRKVTAQTAESTTTWKPFYDRLCIHDSDLTNGGLTLDAAVEILYSMGSAILGRSSFRGEAPELPYPEVDESSDMARARVGDTLHTLTAMVRTCGVLSPTRIGSGVLSDVEKIAAATFAASDAVLAFRDVNSWKTRSEDHSECSSIIGCVNMAARIKEPHAMLVIDLDNVYGIKSMRLINSVINTEIPQMAEAARLIACPWVTAVVHRTALDSEQGWFTLDTSLVQRDMLTVTDKVRETFGAAPARPPKDAATPESVNKLRTDLSERLDKMDKTIAEVKTVRQVVPPAPKAPTREDSQTVLSLRAAVLTLERLTGKKRPSE